MHNVLFYCRMRMRVAIEPDYGGMFRTALDLDLSSLAMDCVFLAMMAHDSQVASNSTTVTPTYHC